VDVGDEAIHRALIHAGFAYDQHDKRLNDLSGGERARVLFVALSLQRPNFLVLDEPTNHIDLEGKEQLEAQLRDSDAALLITSHDRTFINNVADRFIWVCDGGLREISDPHEFFASNPSPASATATAGHNEPSSAQETSLQRLLDLEEKLAADRARKPKFQKPELQAEWAAEIDRLYALLDQET
jgi:ABC-type glutathione transport system ATPase component